MGAGKSKTRSAGGASYVMGRSRRGGVSDEDFSGGTLDEGEARKFEEVLGRYVNWDDKGLDTSALEHLSMELGTDVTFEAYGRDPLEARMRKNFERGLEEYQRGRGGLDVESLAGGLRKVGSAFDAERAQKEGALDGFGLTKAERAALESFRFGAKGARDIASYLCYQPRKTRGLFSDTPEGERAYRYVNAGMRVLGRLAESLKATRAFRGREGAARVGSSPDDVYFVGDMGRFAEAPTAGGVYFFPEKALALGPSLFKAPRTDRPYTVGDGGLANAVHEFGHHVDNTMGGALSEACGRGKAREAVSLYGCSNKQEAFAEAFVCYATGVEPKHGKEYYAKFKRVMEKYGYEALEGCLGDV